MARDDVREYSQIRERRATPFHAVWLGSTIGHEIAADFSARTLDPGIRLSLRHSNLRDGLHARFRRDRPIRQAVDNLPHDFDRLAELDHPHLVPGEAVTRGLDRYGELEILVRRIGMRAPQVVRHAGAAQEGPGDAD